ncbi:MFS transporter [Flexivirga sp. B27]
MTTTRARTPDTLSPTWHSPGEPPTGLLLTVLLGGLFMSLLDASIVNVAVGSLRHGLHTSGAQLQLIVSGYVMSYAVLLITGARLGGRLGHRAVIRSGLLGFVLTSAACGFAPTATALIVCRLAQGAAAALLLPQVMSLIQICFPSGRRRTRALGWYGLVLALGTVSGQLLGGVLLDLDPAGLGWRTVFLVNVPVGLVLLRLSAHALPRHTRTAAGQLDVAGTTVFGAIVGLVVIPLVLGHETGWPTWGFVLWGIVLGILPVFVLIERASSSPVLPGDVLRAPGLLAGVGVILVMITAYAAELFVFAVHFQTTLQMSPMATGLAFLPLAVGFAVSSLSCPRLPVAVVRSLIPVGLLVCAAGFVALGMVMGDGQRPGAESAAVFAIIGVGQGFAVTPVIGLALTKVPAERAGEASGVLSCAFQIAQVIGVAALGSVFLGAAADAGTAAAARLVCLLLAAALSAGAYIARRLLVATR